MTLGPLPRRLSGNFAPLIELAHDFSDNVHLHHAKGDLPVAPEGEARAVRRSVALGSQPMEMALLRNLRSST